MASTHPSIGAGGENGQRGHGRRGRAACAMARGRGMWLLLASRGAHTRGGEDTAGVVGGHGEGPREEVLRKMEPT